MNKIYLIKNLAPWMMDELLAFSELTEFRIIFLREQSDFYKDGLSKLHNNGITINTKPFKSNNIFKKICFLFPFVIRNFNKFFGGYNFPIGAKSIGWFLRLDISLFDSETSIHAQFATQASVLSLMLKEFFNNEIEYSFTFHAHDIYFNNKWFRLLMNNSKKAFSISEYNIEYVLNKYKPIKKEKITLSRLGVFRPKNIDAKKDISNPFKIGLVSWFVEKKGVFYILEALKEIKNENIKFVLAGDGPLKNKILKFVKDNNMEDKVIYIGKIKGQRKVDFFHSLNAFVLPAITVQNDMDGIPVVLMEAISYGLPIITTNVSGIPEICIDKYNGYLIEEKNIEQLCDSILKIYNQNTYGFSTNSLKLSEQYDIEINSKKKIIELGW